MSEEDVRMSFTEHLGELRVRIIRAGVALIVAVLICYCISNFIIRILAYPIAPLPDAIVATVAEDTVAEDTVAEDTAAEDTAAEDTVAEDTVAEDTVAEDTVAEDTAESTVIGQTPGPPESEAPSGPGKDGKITWIVLSPLEIVFVKIKIAGYGGVLLAFPFLLYQIGAFVFPGLKPKERRAALVLIFGCSGLAIGGLATAYWGVFPIFMPYIMMWVPAGIEVKLRLNETLSILIKGFMAFAFAFQFPLIVLTLVYLGLLSPETLKKYRKVAIVGLAIGAALLTPPDPLSMAIMMLPLVILYELSILLSYIVVRKKKQADSEA